MRLRRPKWSYNFRYAMMGSEYVLSFEIGQREGGFYSTRTDRRTEPPSSALAYRFQQFRQILKEVSE